MDQHVAVPLAAIVAAATSTFFTIACEGPRERDLARPLVVRELDLAE